MMERWGLEGMQSFEQKGVKAKERSKVPDETSSAHVAAGHGTAALVTEA